MTIPAVADFAQEARSSQIGFERQEKAERAVMSRPAGQSFAQEARRSKFGVAGLGTTGAGSHDCFGRGRFLRRKPDAVKLAVASREPQTQAVMSKAEEAEFCTGIQSKNHLAGREPQTQAVMCRPAGAEFTQEARDRQVGSFKQGTADADSHGQAGRV
jgi:hypothetical protein